MKRREKAPKEPERQIIYGVSKIAEYFGVHKSTVHKWASQYGFPLRKLGTSAFLVLDELKQWGRSDKSLRRRGVRGLLPDDYVPRLPGLTKEALSAYLEKNGGTCDICRMTFSDNGFTPHVDHDHLTGAVRGLLCRGCNHGIGNFRDSAAILRQAITYLEQPPWGSDGSDKAR